MAVTFADIARLDFAKGAGLMPAIVQDATSGAVLMLGFMNEAALRATLDSGRVTFYSRSKQRLWEKGETSGHYLELASIRADCDADTLLVSARPHGPACHNGTRTCFGEEPQSETEQLAFLTSLARVIEQRIQEQPEGSYTARLYARGTQRVAQKVGEEALEVALAAAADSDEKVIGEAADLLYHLLLLLRSRNLTLPQVVAELEARHASRTESRE